MIWCRLPKQQNPQHTKITISQIWTVKIQSTLPPALSRWVRFYCMTSLLRIHPVKCVIKTCTQAIPVTMIHIQKAYSNSAQGATVQIGSCLFHHHHHTHTHTGRLQAINTHVHAHTNSSPVQQISSAHAVLSCVDAECILKHHHLLPWSHTHSIWHQVYEHLSPLWHLSPAKTNRPYSSDPGAG